MLKKVLSLLVCFGLFLAFTLPVFAEEAFIISPRPETLCLSTTEEFLTFAENCRLDSYSQNLIVTLQDDLSLSGTDFHGVPIFSGTFLGNGHTISGFDLTATGSAQGLFRYLTASAVVEGVHLEGSVQPQGSRDTVGSIAGTNAGTIRDCSFSGSVSGSENIGGIAGINTVTAIIENCQVSGTVHGTHFVGGIAGTNAGAIRTCTNTMQVNTTPQQNSISLDQITLDTLQEAESVNAVTDIGGIAGHSSGVIRDCTNQADVGYRHMGYNIGGIAGSQMGYITDCQNYGAVSGRKEVGGIVGQMEPATSLQFSTDTLQILKEQLNTLSALVNQTSAHAQGSAATIGSQIASIQDQAEAAKEAIEQLIPSTENPELPDLDSLQAAQNTITGSISSMQGSLTSIYASVQGIVGNLERDLQAISNQISAMGQTLNGASETLGGTIADVSDADTPENTLGKVENCSNHGPVLADLNAGGITGAIALENDLNPEEDIQITGDASLNFDSQLRAVIRNCRNNASVSAGKQNVGGIIGWMSMGLVAQSLNTADVGSETASYAGGVAGQQTSGYIRSCSANCVVTGKEYVGGIAGAGQVLSDCRSLTALSASEKCGAVLGYAQTREQIVGNFYLADLGDPGAIDGISYDGCAQALSAEAFLSLEDIDPVFGTVTVQFIFEDGTVQTVSVPYGQALSADQVPVAPEKEGCLAYWDDLESTPLYFDVSYPLRYASRTCVIQAEALLDGMPLLLAEGSFDPSAVITQIDAPSAPVLQRNQTLLQQVSFTVSDSSTPIRIHCRLPAAYEADTIQVLLQREDGSWEPVACQVSDSYVVFSVPSGESHVAVISTAGFPWLMAVGIAAAVLLVAVTVILLTRKKSPKKTPSA